jgi:hypothetical protein
MNMQRSRIRFTQSFGVFAKIEGSACCGDEGVELELAMTECVSGPVKGVLKKSLAFRDLEDVQAKRGLTLRRRLIFLANSLEIFESVPGAKGYEYVVRPVASGRELKSFLTDVRLAIAQATMEHFTEQIEQTIGQ